MAEVVLKNICKSYQDNNFAVKDVSLEIKDREFVVLVGPSGCGKSTTLRMVAGLEEITSGELHIDGKLVNDVSPKDRDIAMVFQNYALYPHMSVYENMAFGLKLRKFPKEEINARVQEAAKILGLEEYLERKPKALSGGQRQRVAVGRAIVRKPKVFLFDEPLSNLDAKLRVQMRTEISRLHQKLGATMIYVTHDQVEAMTMGDRIVVMKDGFVQQIDTPLNLYHNPANRFVAGFIGSPAMNFFQGRITGEQEVTTEQGYVLQLRGRADSSLQNKAVWVGIRPEDIYDEQGGSALQHSMGFDTTIEVVEPMGNEIYLYFSFGGAQFTGRINSRTAPETGKSLRLYFDMTKLHLFDLEKEHAIVLQ